MAEEALLQAVLDLAAYRRVLAVHFPPAYTARGAVITHYRGDGAGWPDLHLTGIGGVLYRELKAEDGRLTAEQQRYLDALRVAGCDADVWRPADLRSGRIAREIAAIARPDTTTTRKAATP
jgi:hypothetical protein